jgi:hypothetical protein
MRVKLQLVLCHDDGREETVTDIVSWQRDYRRIEHLGLTLAESKQLLKRIQKNCCNSKSIGIWKPTPRARMAVSRLRLKTSPFKVRSDVLLDS